jgi:hypothetical protein
MPGRISPRRCGVVGDWDNAVHRILPFGRCRYTFTVLGPAQQAFVVDPDQISLTFLARQISYSLFVQAGPGAFWKFDVFTASKVQPVKEILVGVTFLPDLVIFSERGAIAVFLVDLDAYKAMSKARRM